MYKRQLLSLVNAFVPVISNASVNSVEKGFTVTVTGTLEKDSTNDADAGSAGGFIGCGTGVQISNSDVNKLQHTGVSEPKNLQQEDGSSYYGSDSAYAVNGYRYAGGYIGKAAMEVRRLSEVQAFWIRYFLPQICYQR